jgi:histidyl-tRNA synthetase
MDNTKFGPAKGMRDYLPQDVLLRQKLISKIERCYQLYGFQPIDTPVLENIEVLQGKGGGENEKLMFKVLKRGEDLERSQGASDLADMGLRFDLTVPLARYVGNHWNDLPKPFRCSHIGPVWRADRPQKGRFREFYQCDIDIIGGFSDACEVELLLATDRVLKELGIGKFKIRVSDKGLLSHLLSGFGIGADKIASVALALDKLDKQPVEKVMEEIKALGHSMEVLDKVDTFIKGSLHGHLNHSHFQAGGAEALFRGVESIRKRVHDANPDANVVFDPLLVRGFDYYTGPVFEINVEDKDFTFSIGGGGRYERILLILAEKDKSTPATQSRSAVYLVNQGQHEHEFLAFAESLRSQGIAVEACLEKKDLVKQLKAAQEAGYELAVTEFKSDAPRFKVRRLSTREDKEMNAAELKSALEGPLNPSR